MHLENKWKKKKQSFFGVFQLKRDTDLFLLLPFLPPPVFLLLNRLPSLITLRKEVPKVGYLFTATVGRPLRLTQTESDRYVPSQHPGSDKFLFFFHPWTWPVL